MGPLWGKHFIELSVIVVEVECSAAVPFGDRGAPAAEAFECVRSRALDDAHLTTCGAVGVTAAIFEDERTLLAAELARDPLETEHLGGSPVAVQHQVVHRDGAFQLARVGERYARARQLQPAIHVVYGLFVPALDFECAGRVCRHAHSDTERKPATYCRNATGRGGWPKHA